MMAGTLIRILLLLVIWLVPARLNGHEIRPAYLQLEQTAPSQYHVLWKLPRSGESVPDIHLQFGPNWTLRDHGREVLRGDFVVFRYHLEGPPDAQLAGSRLTVRNLERTKIDVLVHMNLLAGIKQTFLIHPSSPAIMIPTTPSRWDVISLYTWLGIEHILLGFDHLLFVLALIFLTNGLGKTIKTVTAFTIAHSITLSLATLGYAEIPGKPVEAMIALSIVFLAVEIVRAGNGKETLTQQRPWLIAFTFGLLHGFGFAGALTEIGLPSHEIPLALASFNLGVELGQVVFILVTTMLMLSLKSIFRRQLVWHGMAWQASAYLIGAISSYWLIDRLHGFL